MYIKHPYKNHDEWSEENLRKRESYKKGRYQHIGDGENSTENSGSGKSFTLYSQTQYAL